MSRKESLTSQADKGLHNPWAPIELPKSMVIEAPQKPPAEVDTKPAAVSKPAPVKEQAAKASAPAPTQVPVPPVASVAPAKKNRPEPPKVITTPAALVKSEKSTLPATPITPALSPAPMVQRQGTLMMRIVSSNSASSKAPSKKTSTSSVRPGTPGDVFSDTASTTSSARAMTPPPHSPLSQKVINQNPPPAVPKKTKSSIRKEKKKESELKVEAITTAVKEEPEHEPIVSRAKAKKKEKKTSAPSSKTASRAESPAPKPVVSLPPVAGKPAEQPAPKVVEPQTPVVVEKVVPETKEPEVQPESKKEATTKPTAQILADLQKSGEINFSELEMLKPVVGLTHKFEFTSEELANLNLNRTVFQKQARNEFLEAEGAFKPTGSRYFISPNGASLRGLTPEMEERYCVLERRIAEDKGPYKWTRADPKEHFIPRFNTEGANAQMAASHAKTAHEFQQKLQEKMNEWLNGAKATLTTLMNQKGKDGKLNESQMFFSGKQSGSISIDEALSLVEEIATASAQAAASPSSKANKSLLSSGAIDPSVPFQALQESILSAMSNISPSASGKHGISNAHQMHPHHHHASASVTTNGENGEFTGMELAIGMKVPIMSGFEDVQKLPIEEIRKQLVEQKKEAEGFEKRMNGMIKKNRKLAGVVLAN
ncbi:hypothetical protein BJ508DRAFT_41603 [Ascobolus immersus RN42]|uniref:Uncharacterized protein n=1 Tax=Ascobolus immersus RN42 TaxID=1160509 RepID=A0A3N4IHG7_ASCIM|nr:hypothetical protein BJ508DRAFT_41603 [Ascobolus immersus RN42]